MIHAPPDERALAAGVENIAGGLLLEKRLDLLDQVTLAGVVTQAL